MKIIFNLLVLTGIFSFLTFGVIAQKQEIPKTKSKTPVLVELFTS